MHSGQRTASRDRLEETGILFPDVWPHRLTSTLEASVSLLENGENRSPGAWSRVDVLE